MNIFIWSLFNEFVDRTEELEHLQQWWDDTDRQPIAIIGRRRVGKSWLFRKFAHGKAAVILVAEQLPPGTQLTRFAEILEKVIGIRPDLPDVNSLFRVLFKIAQDKKLLVVIDEFPWLIGSGVEAQRILTSLQSIMEEERDESQLKLVLCGSNISFMETLFGEKSPMHGRLQRLEVRPMQFSAASLLFPNLTPLEAFERFAVAGGMPLYLARLSAGTLKDAACREILSPSGPLWNEGRTLIDQELREPRIYFGILELLATGEKEINEIAQPLRLTTSLVAKYLGTLVDLHLVGKHLPFGAPSESRKSHWRIEDPFLRFWFRFVFPFQSELESGLKPADLFAGEIAPSIADHVATVFEDWCREWLRSNFGTTASRIGCWWGNSSNENRRTKKRQSEEIDAIGTLGNRVTIVAECKWTRTSLGVAIVHDLDIHKIPALTDGGFNIASDLKVILFSKSGYTAELRAMAKVDKRLVLVDVGREMAQYPTHELYTLG